MKAELWAADTFRFKVCGGNCRKFLSVAALRGVHFRRIFPGRDGYTGVAFGPDRSRLLALAREYDCTFEIMTRRGPGRRAERLLARPGILIGGLTFLLLLRFFSGFLWCIDFGEVPAELQAPLRVLLTDCGVYEGIRLTDPLLRTAQYKALQQSDTFGWISLNFTGGCLYIEETPSQQQDIRGPTPQQCLYAKDAGEVLAIEIESGFCAVTVGQTVEQGQLLADSQKSDWKGRPVEQGAAGKVLARIQKTYTASQPLQAEAELPTPHALQQRSLSILGKRYEEQGAEAIPDARISTELSPLRLGRLALPGAWLVTTQREYRAETISYSADTARALALRQCLQLLRQDYPDAVIEAEQREVTADDTSVNAAIRYIFRANIAVSAP